MINVAMLFAWGKPDLKPVLVAYLGLILQGGCLLAIGIFISTTTRNQIVAGGVTFFVCLLLWLLSWFTAFDSSATAQVVNYLSIVTHFENFSKGVIDSKDVVFYLSMIFFCAVYYASGHGIAAVEGIRWLPNGSSSRQAKYSAYAGVYIIVILAVLAAVNFLANRYDKSYDSTANKQFTLSDQTLKVVHGLKHDVTITDFAESIALL